MFIFSLKRFAEVVWRQTDGRAGGRAAANKPLVKPGLLFPPSINQNLHALLHFGGGAARRGLRNTVAGEITQQHSRFLFALDFLKPHTPTHTSPIHHPFVSATRRRRCRRPPIPFLSLKRNRERVRQSTPAGILCTKEAPK